MRKYFITILLISLIITFSDSNAQNCTIINPLVIEAGNFNQKNIIQKINEINVSFDETEIAGIGKLVKDCNIQLNMQISTQKSKRDELYKDKQELLKVQDISKLNEHLKAKKESLGEIKDQTRDELKSVSFKGLYIAIIKNINPNTESKSSLTDKTITALSPVAIEDVKGTFIKSLTQVSNSSGIKDYIESEISGEMTVEASPVTNINPKDKVFITLLMVSVAPLQKSVITGNYSPQVNNSGIFIINVMSDPAFRETLIQHGIAAERIQELENEIKHLKELVVMENRNASNREQNIIDRGLKNRLQLEKEIADLHNEIKNHSQLLKTTIETKTPVKFDEANTEAGIKAAHQYIDRQIKNIEDKIFELKAMELIFEPNIQVTYENLPAEEIAKKTIDKYMQLEKKYERVERFMEKITINDAQITGYESGQDIDIYRKIDKIWLFPVPGENDNFTLHLVAKFKITDKPVSGTNEVAAQPGSVYTHNRNGVSIEFVSIPGGTFTMGSPENEINRDKDETPHQVTLTAFKMSKFEVTFEQYDAFCNATGRGKPDDEGWGRGRRPVINVSWDDAMAFASWIGCHLPSEAQWEYACRAGTTMPFYTGNCLSADDANFNSNIPFSSCSKGQYKRMTLPVGSYKANAWQLYDMPGNVEEWCIDSYDKYSTYLVTDPKKISSDRAHRVVRGGKWLGSAMECRSANRNYMHPVSSYDSLGFRLVLLP